MGFARSVAKFVKNPMRCLSVDGYNMPAYMQCMALAG